MKRGPQRCPVASFGKLPSRADFIKAGESTVLVTLLDQWLAEVMNALTADPRWKLKYDALRPLHFAFVGTRRKRAIAGHIVASCDQSQRRYPFLSTIALDVEAPQTFLARSPLVLDELWRDLEVQASALFDAAEPEPALQALAAMAVEIEPGGEQHEAVFERFLDDHSIASLQAMLGLQCVRQMILALGLLLRPMRGAVRHPDKSVLLPLPGAADCRHLVATLWLDLMAPFLRNDDLELALFIVDNGERHALAVGFDGAAPQTLHALIDPPGPDGHLIQLEQADWVSGELAADPRVQKLSAYLEQGQLSLRSAQALFHETFA